MPWVYLVKVTTRQGMWYLNNHGKWRFNTDRDVAKQFETRESAESRAFLMVSKDPEILGKVAVVRCSPLI